MTWAQKLIFVMIAVIVLVYVPLVIMQVKLGQPDAVWLWCDMLHVCAK